MADSLRAERVEPLLRGRLGRPYTFVERCASTQRLIDEDAPEGAAVATDEQTDGRGRLGRRWEAAPGTSLLVSLRLVPAVPSERLPELTVLAAEAVAASVQALTGLGATVKDPNDVLVDGHKVAGVLAEAAGGRVTLGIGINVHQRADELPPRTPLPATSLAAAGASLDRAVLLADVLDRLERRYDAWVAQRG